MRLWIISCLLCCALCAMARGDMVGAFRDSTEVVSSPTGAISPDSIAYFHEAELMERIEKYEQRLEKYHHFFHSLVPEFIRFQYAGSTGLLNLGAGWNYGRRSQHETDFMFGYIPRYDKDSPLFTFTLRQTFVPWAKPLYGQRFSFQPLACGLFVNSVLSSEYWTREPKRYPDGSYYRFSSKLRFHLFVGQRYTFHIPIQKRFLARQVSFVWELSSCDLYIVSKFPNKSLPWHEILSLSLGLKYDF